MPQLSFASLTPKTKNIRSETFLNEMLQIVPWNEIIKIIEPFYPKKGFVIFLSIFKKKDFI